MFSRGSARSFLSAFCLSILSNILKTTNNTYSASSVPLRNVPANTWLTGIVMLSASLAGRMPLCRAHCLRYTAHLKGERNPPRGRIDFRLCVIGQPAVAGLGRVLVG